MPPDLATDFDFMPPRDVAYRTDEMPCLACKSQDRESLRPDAPIRSVTAIRAGNCDGGRRMETGSVNVSGHSQYLHRIVSSERRSYAISRIPVVAVSRRDSEQRRGIESVYVVHRTQQGGMLRWPLRIRVVDSAKEIRVLTGIPFMRELDAKNVSFAEMVIQIDIEGLLSQGAGPLPNPVVIRIVSRSSDVQIR